VVRLPLFDVGTDVVRAAPPLVRADPPGVSARAVRISLTDRCDLACIYCRPHRNDGYLRERLDVDAWVHMVEGLVQGGIRRVRITGGEPLLHRDVVTLVARLAALPIDDLALTTNATRLKALAKPLRNAGLKRLNISIDSLDPVRFARLTRGGDLATVLDGVDAALACGFDELKLNTVVVRGENDDELEAIASWAWQRGIVPRFLEVMLIGEGAKLREQVVTVAEMRARLAHLLAEGAAQAEPSRGPARYVAAREGGNRRIGFISGTSDTYCEGCDRLRVASDGTLRSCLAKGDGVSASEAARAHDVAGVTDALERAWADKPDGKTFRGCTEESARLVSMRAIGG
jgi:cyclic pyranopterin phosphate synthase